MNDPRPVDEAMEMILSALDIIAEMALSEKDYAEVAAKESALGQIKSRAELILSFIDARKPAKTRIWRVQ